MYAYISVGPHWSIKLLVIHIGMKNDSGCVTEPLSIMICLIYVFCVIHTAVRVGGDSAMDKLLFKLLASMEEIKQTQRLHSATLQSIMRQLKNSDVPRSNPFSHWNIWWSRWSWAKTAGCHYQEDCGEFDYYLLTLLQFYRLLHCLQIQSQNSLILWCKHFWTLTILSMHFWFDIIYVDFGVEIIYYYYYYY